MYRRRLKLHLGMLFLCGFAWVFVQDMLKKIATASPGQAADRLAHFNQATKVRQ